MLLSHEPVHILPLSLSFAFSNAVCHQRTLLVRDFSVLLVFIVGTSNFTPGV